MDRMFGIQNILIIEQIFLGHLLWKKSATRLSDYILLGGVNFLTVLY